MHFMYNAVMTANVAQTQQRGFSEYFCGDLCLLGLGVTGRAVLAFFNANPAYYNTLTVFGARATELELLAAQELSSKIILYPDSTEVTGSYDLAVVSPGIPPHSLLYRGALASARELISEPELAWRISPERWIAITGTNGKTTTTALIAHLFATAGVPARAVGNIGDPCIEAISQRAVNEYLIVELSSYQLYSTIDFAPNAAVLLNITPDHLIWHGTHEAYTQAKLKIFANHDSSTLAVIDATSKPMCSIAQVIQKTDMQLVCVRTAESLDSCMLEQANNGEAYLSNEPQILTVDLGKHHYSLCPASDLKICGEHNYTNALAATSVALFFGLSPEAICLGLKSFEALEHRLEFCGEHNGVRYFNDSKATNTDAAIKAIEAFATEDERYVIALFGGRDKGTDLSDLVESSKHSCRLVICYGEAAERFYVAFSSASAFATVRVEGFYEACKAALEASCVGDVVLLSPACASFDEFTSFEARGKAFKTFVAGLSQDDCEESNDGS